MIVALFGSVIVRSDSIKDDKYILTCGLHLHLNEQFIFTTRVTKYD